MKRGRLYTSNERILNASGYHSGKNLPRNPKKRDTNYLSPSIRRLTKTSGVQRAR